MTTIEIRERIAEFIESLPAGVRLVAAAKTRTAEEVRAAIDAGVTILGYNYVQEAERMRAVIGDRARWHLIGHLQRNKAKKAVELFDMIETVDSMKLASTVNRHCSETSKVMPVLVEVNSGREPNKSGVFPGAVAELVARLADLENIRVEGLMTMGAFSTDPEASRQFFRETRAVFETIAAKNPPRVTMRYLSMGMSDSYKVALEEGANIVRIGTRLFGPRQYQSS